eukprot:scaffold179385_cov35-Tisochrysis_lutea.AAC.2
MHRPLAIFGCRPFVLAISIFRPPTPFLLFLSSEQLLALMGGQFKVGDEICGAVLSIRYQEDLLSVWNKSADSRRICLQIRDTLRAVIGLQPDAVMEYKKHTDSMRDNSSYRNANANFL